MRRPPLLQMTTIGCSASSSADSGHTINSLEDPRYHQVSMLVRWKFARFWDKTAFHALVYPWHVSHQGNLDLFRQVGDSDCHCPAHYVPCRRLKVTASLYCQELNLSRRTLLSTNYLYHFNWLCMPVIPDTRLPEPQHRAQLNGGEGGCLLSRSTLLSTGGWPTLSIRLTTLVFKQ